MGSKSPKLPFKAIFATLSRGERSTSSPPLMFDKELHPRRLWRPPFSRCVNRWTVGPCPTIALHGSTSWHKLGQPRSSYLTCDFNSPPFDLPFRPWTNKLKFLYKSPTRTHRQLHLPWASNRRYPLKKNLPAWVFLFSSREVPLSKSTQQLTPSLVSLHSPPKVLCTRPKHRKNVTLGRRLEEQKVLYLGAQWEQHLRKEGAAC